jgi:TRAP-type C4-dicarboxylate transport system substrate-binding protein
MTWLKHTITVGLVAPAAALALFGCGGSTANKAGGTSAPKPVVLTVANPIAAGEELDTLISEVNRLSGGSLKLDVISRWRYGQVGFETGVIEDIQAGKADIGIAGARAWDTVGDKSFEALTAPMLISSYALQEKVLSSPIAKQMLASLKGLGLTGLGIRPGPLRYAFGNGRPLLGPADYRGKALGVTESSVAAASFRALGASDIRYLSARGPETGLAGNEQGVSSYFGGSHPHGGYLTGNVVLWPRPLVIFANSARFARLSDKQRQILSIAASDVTAQTSWLRNDSAYAVAGLCRAGRTRFVEATPGDIAALRSAMRPVYASLDRTASTRAFILSIEAMRGATGSEPALTCAGTGAAAARPGQLDGVYQFTVTASDMRSAHADPGESIPENLGAMVFVFDRGRFADTQVYGPACTWGYGNVTFTPTTLTLTLANGGGISPNGAFSKPGEQFTYEWSLYHNVLSLNLPPNAGPEPTAWHAVPWQRDSTTPSTSYFPKRCPPPTNALTR